MTDYVLLSIVAVLSIGGGVYLLFKVRTHSEGDQDLGALADAAKGAADRACVAIDDATAFIAASDKRIAIMESAAEKPTKATSQLES